MKSVTYIAAMSMMGWCESLDGCAPVYSEGTGGTASSTSSTGDSGATSAPTGSTAPTGQASTDPTGEASTDPTGIASTGSTGEVSASTGTGSTSSSSEVSTTSTSTGDAATMSTGDASTTSTGDASTASTGGPLPDAAVLNVNFSQVKTFNFSWAAAMGAQYYELHESPTDDGIYEQVGVDPIFGESISVTMPLHLRFGASYILKSCNADGCTDSAPLKVMDSMVKAVGYFKASNTGPLDMYGDFFGYVVAISDDGNTLAVGAPNEDSSKAGINQVHNELAIRAGAVYVFVRGVDNKWTQQAYIKASNPGAHDQFGLSIALSGDGTTLAVGAHLEDHFDESVLNSGAVYVFVRSGTVWTQMDYLKASNKGQSDSFGHNVALSADGKTIAVGAYFEDSTDVGINGQKNDNAAQQSGAVYVFEWDNKDWKQQAYIKASNTGVGDEFGHSVAMSADGNTLAVGAPDEDSPDKGMNGAEGDNFDLAEDSGAVYVFVRLGDVWSKQAYIKASNTGKGDRFGLSAAMSADGNTLAVGAYLEDSAATGVGGLQDDNVSFTDSGAVYMFTRAKGDWEQQAYIKASNTEASDQFGINLALSGDGKTLAVSAKFEDSAAAGVGGQEDNNVATTQSGAVYVFKLSDNNTWSQRGYVKASNTGKDDNYGLGIALRDDGTTLAIGAYLEDSSAVGIGKDQASQANNKFTDAGAVYVY
jgi:hypothetical protein